MTNKNKDFCFIPERNRVVPVIAWKTEERVFTFFYSIFIVSVLLVAGMYFYNRLDSVDISSDTSYRVTKEFSELDPQQLIELDSFLIRLKANQGFSLSKFDIVLQVSGNETKNEITSSINTIRHHLIFILSGKEALSFINYKQENALKKEIINQLNLFLIAGKVEQIQLKQTALN